MSKKGSKEKGMNLCYEARKIWGGQKDMTLEVFGQRTGRPITTIHRRENGSRLDGAIQVLYRLIILMCKNGLRDELNRISDAIPEGEQSEERLLTELTMFCSDTGRKQLIHLANEKINVVDYEPDEESEKGFGMNEAIRFLTIMQKDFERQAKVKPELAHIFLEAAKNLNGTSFDLKRRKAELENKESSNEQA